MRPGGPGHQWSVRSALEYLRQGGTARLRVAQLLALVDEPIALWITARVLDADPAVVRSIIATLTRTKIVAYCQFRNTEIRDAVLIELPLAVRQRLHRRLAEVLHECAAPPTRVAQHLLGAGEIHLPWAASALRGAAEDAISDDEIPSAIEYLELASRLTVDDAERAGMLLMLAMIRWRLNPSTSNRSFGRLVAMMRAGSMPVQCLPLAVRCLLWHGRFDDAVVALEQLDTAATGGEPAAIVGRTTLREWLACHYPGLLGEIGGKISFTSESDRVAMFLHSGWRVADADAGRLLADVFMHGECSHAIVRARRLVRAHRLDDTTFGALLMVLDAMTYGGRLDSASSWCESLMLEAAARRAPAWQAIFGIWRSTLYVRTGELDAAIDSAGRALGRVRGESLGTYAGLAVASLVEASTAAGRYREAASYLETNLPESVLQSRIGLHFRRARGRYLTAVGEFGAAEADFLAVGQRMMAWQMDIPGVVPWRNDMAELHLAADDPGGMRAWASAHIGHLRDAARHSSGAVSLRVMAAAASPQQRVGLLRRAVEIAGNGVDTLELATVLSDMADAYREVGERDRARTAARRALRLAEQCGAEPLRAKLSGSRESVLKLATSAEHSHRETVALSQSELRVARLAAAGHRNREIAGELHITTSTVEQHLTRVYRKLSVTRRADLAVALDSSVGASAFTEAG